jgi:hypothetical protein
MSLEIRDRTGRSLQSAATRAAAGHDGKVESVRRSKTACALEKDKAASDMAEKLTPSLLAEAASPAVSCVLRGELLNLTRGMKSHR